MIRTKLQMDFKDQLGKNFRLSVDEPREDLSNEEVKEFMEFIIEKDAFDSKGFSLSTIAKAQKVTTEVEEIEL